MYYRFENGLEPLAERPERWGGVLAVVPTDDEAERVLPEELLAAVRLKARENQYCRLAVDPEKICGLVHVPARQGRGAALLTFAWWESNLLIVDHDRVMEGLIRQIKAMRKPYADGADNFLTDLLLLLVADDLAYIQELEARCAELEQAVLKNRTGGFIERMSGVRRELNRSNRYYAQLGDFARTLQENAGDLFDRHSASRLGAFLRRVGALREETQMLREYATQVSSEYQAQVDIDQNRIMKTLTIVTTIFLPLTLLVGWYGMNFDMPELKWTYGYPAVILLSALVVGACVLFFRKKHFW